MKTCPMCQGAGSIEMADEEGFTTRVDCKDCQGSGEVADDFKPASVTYDPDEQIPQDDGSKKFNWLDWLTKKSST